MKDLLTKVFWSLHDPLFEDVSEDGRASKSWTLMAVLALLGGVLLRNRFLTTAGFMLVALLLGAWLWAKFSLAALSYQRQFHVSGTAPGNGASEMQEVRAFLGETVDMTLTLHNRKFLPLNRLRIVDIFPLQLPITGAEVRRNPVTNRGEFISLWMPGAYQKLTRRFVIRCTQRGTYFFGPAVINGGDGFGFFDRSMRLKSLQRLIIYPRIYTTAELGLPAKNPFGERVSKQRIFEDPLRPAGIREWRSGDSLRRIHWKATARHQALLSRVYEPSEEPQIQIVLNVATLERHWEGVVPERLELVVSVAASLAALCIERRMPVGLTANGYLPGSDQHIRVLPGRSHQQLVAILENLAAVTEYATRAIEAELLSEAPKLPWGATLLVVTAVTYPALLDTLQNLASAGRKIVLFSLSAEPPQAVLPGIQVYHLSHLVDEVIAPAVVIPEATDLISPAEMDAALISQEDA